jgi:hypothetical protein
MNSGFWNAQLNNLENYIADLETPLIELGKLVKQWWQDYQKNELSLREQYLLYPVITALMSLPPLTRQELCGKDLESLHKELETKATQNSAN